MWWSFVRLTLAFVATVYVSDAQLNYDEASQRQILTDFYHAMNGDSWVNNTNWLVNNDQCSWFGVRCGELGLRRNVTRLELVENNLKGEFPPSFTNLNTLIYLELTGNLISGTIPESICQMPNLFTLNFQLNFLTGSIPDCWPTRRILAYVFLQFNKLSGPLPVSFGNLPLRSLDVNGNNLEGQVPPELCNTNNTLANLALTNNYFTGPLPMCFQFFSRMENLLLGENDFTGPFPSKIFTFPPLQSLIITNNHFNGTIPDSFVSNSLEVLWLSFNEFSGRLPGTLSNCFALTDLRMDNNQFDGIIPSAWATLESVQLVQINNNKLSGDLVPISCVVSGEPPILILIASNNNLTGNIDQVLRMTSLQRLDLSYNQLSGSIPDQLVTNSEFLSRVELHHNNFTGKLPDLNTRNSFKLKPAPLTYLDLSYNMISGQMSLVYLPQMTTFRLNNNRLSGHIYMVYSDTILEVNYSNNSFVGEIPDGVGKLSTLEFLSVDNNQLSGELPMQLGALKTLRVFSCSRNSLTISNLTVLTQLRQIQTLDISHNKIKTELPFNIGDLRFVQTLDVSNNDMYGELPASLYKIPSLIVLRLNNNRFTGSIVSLQSDPDEIDFSNNQFAGSVLWMGDLTSIRLLNIANNSFSGGVPDISSYKQAVKIDLGYNALTSLPNILQLTRLEEFAAFSNQLQGGVPEFEGSNSLYRLDLGQNLLTDASNLAQLPNLALCNLEGNSFDCPVTWQAYDSCSARCSVKNKNEKSSLRIKYSGEYSTFDKDAFIGQISSVGNFSSKRIQVLASRVGSIVVDFNINPSEEYSTNEGSSGRVASKLISEKSRPSFSNAGIQVIEISYLPAESEPSKPLLPIYIGIGIGVLVILIILAIVIVLLVMRSRRIKRQQRAGLYNQFAMIDVSTINLGTAKNAIIPFKDITEMKQIGSGAFGVVYKARWRELDVAVKQIRAEHVTEQQLRDFLQEVGILQNLRSHPNVVLFLAVTFPPDPLSLITEFCEGGSLYDHLRQKKVSLDEKYKFISGIALGMLHLHSERVIHRDLACRNVLLTKYLEPKVCDFGLSREQASTDTASVTSATVGPLKWMAPEAIKSREYSTRSDVFSFGVVIWEILTIQEPFAGMAPVECALSIVNDNLRLTIPTSVEPNLSSLMKRCWEADPAKRPDFREIYTQLTGEKSPMTQFGTSFQKSPSIPPNQPVHYGSHNAPRGADQTTYSPLTPAGSRNW